MLTAAPPLPTEAGVAAVVCGYDPSCENAFGALRRARQTRNKNHNSAIYAQSEAERILNRPFPALLRQHTSFARHTARIILNRGITMNYEQAME